MSSPSPGGNKDLAPFCLCVLAPTFFFLPYFLSYFLQTFLASGTDNLRQLLYRFAIASFTKDIFEVRLLYLSDTPVCRLTSVESIFGEMYHMYAIPV